MSLSNGTSPESEQTTMTTPNSSNTTLEELNSEQRMWFLPVLVIYVLLMIVGIIGNVLVLLIYKMKFKRSSARVYILTLALTDLSVCVVGIPYHVLDLTLLLTYTYKPLCKALSFLIGSCTLSSIFVLLVVGLDRYMKVCRPLKRQIVDFGDRRACIIAIIVAIVISIPNAILYGHSSVETGIDNLNGIECFIDDYYQSDIFGIAYLGFNLLVFILSVVFLLVIYGFICRKIYQSGQDDQISSQGKAKLCSCKSPDTDSVDSYDMEQNESISETAFTTVANGCSASPSYESGLNVIGKDKLNADEGHDVKATEGDVNIDASNSKEGVDSVEKVHTPVTTDVPKDKTKKRVTLESDNTKDMKDGNGAAVNSNDKGSGNNDTSNTETEKEALINAEKQAQKSEAHVSTAEKAEPPSTTSSKVSQKLRPVRSDTMIRHGVKKEKHTRKITLMMLTITVVFILSYLPFIVISLLDGIFEGYWSDMSKEESIMIDFLLRLYIINNVANPIIYSFWDNRFRGECKALIRRIFCCKTPKQKQPKKFVTSVSGKPTFALK